ncbi:DUF1566 domain-containing protein [Myxococcota bacterium]
MIRLLHGYSVEGSGSNLWVRETTLALFLALIGTMPASCMRSFDVQVLKEAGDPGDFDHGDIHHGDTHHGDAGHGDIPDDHGVSCQEDDDCGEGAWCDTTIPACQPCNTDEHCGSKCEPCDLSMICHADILMCGAGLDCSGFDDFTPCRVNTTPERDYDICVAGTCVSPGCGTTSCNPPGPHFPLPDTNQRTCYDTVGVAIACPGSTPCSDIPLCGQDAQYGWDTQHPETDRFDRDETNPDEPVVLDAVTGLLWQGCAGGLRGRQCQVQDGPQDFTWAEALAFCDNLSWSNLDGWHLPDEYELASLLHADIYDPAIDPGAFPATPNDWYWTSSSSAAVSADARTIRFGSGDWGRHAKTERRQLRCVRDTVMPTMPSVRFIREDQTDPIVRDEHTGLIWQGCVTDLYGQGCTMGAAQALPWEQALAYCEGLSWAGMDSWRLPNIMEIWSIIDNQTSTPPFDSTFFPGTPSTGALWASTTNRYESSEAWAVWLQAVEISYTNIKDNLVFVRCVLP